MFSVMLTAKQLLRKKLSSILNNSVNTDMCDIIIIDDVSKNVLHPLTALFVPNEEFTIKRNGEPSFKIVPTVIIICECTRQELPESKVFKNNYLVIETTCTVGL